LCNSESNETHAIKITLKVLKASLPKDLRKLMASLIRILIKFKAAEKSEKRITTLI
jgi:hypothetical protein